MRGPKLASNPYGANLLFGKKSQAANANPELAENNSWATGSLDSDTFISLAERDIGNEGCQLPDRVRATDIELLSG